MNDNRKILRRNELLRNLQKAKNQIHFITLELKKMDINADSDEYIYNLDINKKSEKNSRDILQKKIRKILTANLKNLQQKKQKADIIIQKN